MNVKNMSFFHYWKESLALVFSKNIKLLLFATAKAIVPVYKTLLIDFWWLFILCTGLDLTLRFHWYSSWTSHITFMHWMFMIVWFIAWTLLGTVTFLIIRPSVKKKGISYFLQYKKHYLCFLLFTFVARLAIRLFWFLVTEDKFIFLVTLPISILFSLVFFLTPSHFGITTIYFSPFFVFLSLFLFDTKDCFSHLKLIVKRTATMIFYNYPVCLILFILFVGIDILLRNFILAPVIWYSFKMISMPTMTVGTAMAYEHAIAENIVKLFMPVSLCFMANVYTLLVHNEVDLYFK